MADKNNSMQLWEAVSRTDTKYLKDGQKGLSSIDGYYVFSQATNQFGPCGIGWGYEILEEDYRTGAPVYSKDKSEVLGHEIDHMVKVSLWYKWQGEKGQVTHYGVTRYVYSSKYGLITDEEAPKKSLTDALKKCLSMIGFCADVYMGMFEDSAYRASAERRAEAERSAKQEEAIEKNIEELDQWIVKEIEGARLIKDEMSFVKAIDAILKKLKTKGLALDINIEKRAARLESIRNERQQPTNKRAA